MDSSQRGHQLEIEDQNDASRRGLWCAFFRRRLETTSFSLLLLNVFYMYYIDHHVLLLFLRGLQVALIMLLPRMNNTSTFPHVTQANYLGFQLYTAVMITNLPILTIQLLFLSTGLWSNTRQSYLQVLDSSDAQTVSLSSSHVLLKFWQSFSTQIRRYLGPVTSKHLDLDNITTVRSSPDMLILNVMGEEPHGLLKILFSDLIQMLTQAIILVSKLDVPSSLQFVITRFPEPAADLGDLASDPNVDVVNTQHNVENHNFL